MHRDIPPPGKALVFPEWSATIVGGVKKLIPDIVVTRQGARRVIMRNSGRTCTLVDDGAYWVRFGEGGGIPMASLYDADRRDSFTCGNFALSIAGYFDGKFAHARNER